MSGQPQRMEVFLDLLSRTPKNDQAREGFRQVLGQQFQDELANVVERVRDLPPMIVKPHGEYLALLIEARKLYLFASWYSKAGRGRRMAPMRRLTAKQGLGPPPPFPSPSLLGLGRG